MVNRNMYNTSLWLLHIHVSLLLMFEKRRLKQLSFDFTWEICHLLDITAMAGHLAWLAVLFSSIMSLLPVSSLEEIARNNWNNFSSNKCWVRWNISFLEKKKLIFFLLQMSQLMSLWYLPYRRPVKAQASLRIRAVHCSQTWSMEVDEESDQKSDM